MICQLNFLPFPESHKNLASHKRGINYASALMVNVLRTEKYTCKCELFQGLFLFPWGYEVLIHKTLTQSAPTRLISVLRMNALQSQIRQTLCL